MSKTQTPPPAKDPRVDRLIELIVRLIDITYPQLDGTTATWSPFMRLREELDYLKRSHR